MERERRGDKRGRAKKKELGRLAQALRHGEGADRGRESTTAKQIYYRFVRFAPVVTINDPARLGNAYPPPPFGRAAHAVFYCCALAVERNCEDDPE